MDTKYLDIIKAPVVTEKASAKAANENVYSFFVAIKSNKTEIKLAIEKLFGVKVTSIKTISVHPKKKRVGKYTGYTNHKKKAIVTLAEGQTIETA
jgi:large subunit ribosomal protein L23